jgi:hypothetical protein
MAPKGRWTSIEPHDITAKNIILFSKTQIFLTTWIQFLSKNAFTYVLFHTIYDAMYNNNLLTLFHTQLICDRHV